MIGLPNCEDSRIWSRAITLSNFKFGVNSSQEFRNFFDSMDSISIVASGTCGQKLFDSNANTLPFISINPDPSNLISGGYTVNFDANAASYDDITTHTISYEVTSKDYYPSVAKIFGSF